MEVSVSMDPLFLAWSCCRRRQLQRSADICSKILSESPFDQVSAQLAGYLRISAHKLIIDLLLRSVFIKLANVIAARFH